MAGQSPHLPLSALRRITAFPAASPNSSVRVGFQIAVTGKGFTEHCPSDNVDIVCELQLFSQMIVFEEPEFFPFINAKAS